jgi:hypothetical protein
MASPKDFSPFVPFDLYDFFGYLFPGVLFVASVLFFYNNLSPGFYNHWFSYSSNQYEIPFVIGIALVVGAIVILYSLGHIIATLSHIIIDRVLIDGIEGYPINFLLKIPHTTREYSEASFKYLFACFNILLLLPALPFQYSTIFVLIIVILFLILLLIGQRIIVMLVHNRANGHEIARRIGAKKSTRLLLVPSIYLFDPAIEFLRKLLGMDRRFSDRFIELYRELFSKRFNGLVSIEEGSDNYWLPAFDATSIDEIHDRTLHTWLHLYGFARNAAASLYLSSSLIICYLLFKKEAYTDLVPMQLGIQWVLAAFFGIRYWILYSHYYTKGVIRAFVEVETRNK